MNGTYYKFDKSLLTKECQFVITKRRSKTIHDFHSDRLKHSLDAYYIPVFKLDAGIEPAKEIERNV